MKDIKIKIFTWFSLILVFTFTGCFKDTESLSGHGDNTDIYFENEREIRLEMNYKFYFPNDTTKIEFKTLIPGDYPSRQKINSIGYNVIPQKIYNIQDNKYAFFVFEETKDYFELSIDCSISIYDYDLLRAEGMSDLHALAEGSQDVDIYIEEEKYIESKSRIINEIAYGLMGKDTKDTVKAIYDYVIGHLEYGGYNPDNTGAIKALKQGRGDCTEYSDLFVALCRASGIPARVIEGYTCEKGDRSIGHNWSEVYFEDIGWVPFDPTYQDSGADISFYDIGNNYLYLSFLRNDPSLLNFHYYSYYYWGDEPEIIKEVLIK